MPTTVFIGSQAACMWTGRTWTEDEVVAMSANITERALDLALEDKITSTLQDVSSTGVSAEWLTSFLQDAISHELLPWQIGEAIAEVILEDSHGVIFPWNTRRDARNPRASLPGADLVGLSNESPAAPFVFGEVKSSSDTRSPPGVLTGKSGMNQQLERLIDDRRLLLTLIKWLSVRVNDGETEALLDAALRSFVESSGSSIRLVGVLVRDTSASERDVSTRAKALGEKVSAPGSVELHVMYMPRPMDRWIEWVVA